MNHLPYSTCTESSVTLEKMIEESCASMSGVNFLEPLVGGADASQEYHRQWLLTVSLSVN